MALNPVTHPFRAAALASAVGLLIASGSVHAQAATGETTMVKLIRGLIQSGALKKDVGEALLAQARAEAQATQQLQRQVAAQAAQPTQTAGVKAEPGDVRVPYVPQTVRDQIRDEVKSEVLAQAKTERWAAPDAIPAWTQGIRVEGDVRVRNESRFLSNQNSNIEIDWAAINAGTGFDVNTNTNTKLPPLLNTSQNRRNQWRVRARLGVFADISESTQAGIRLASGSDNNPVSTTQLLGTAQGKKNVWLDQAWISHKPADWVTITGGRFANPFWSTDLLFSQDLNFDGIAANFSKTLRGDTITVFGTAGVIPLEYSADGFPSRSQNKSSSENKWLFAAQAGAEWKVDSRNTVRGAVGYYNFNNVTGQVSQPCALYSGLDNCSTDWSRPAFMQKGNTLMLLRNIALNPLDPANTPQPQYVGLASEFRLLDLNARWDTKVMGNYGLRFDANYIRNLAYDADKMWQHAGPGGIVNNFGGTGGTNRSDFHSGGNAYMFQATFGKPAPSARGDWNVIAGYKRIEADSMPDGYNDPTFHGGGTNARGYYFGGSYAVDKNAWFTGRWISTREVTGPRLSIDTLQLDFNAKF